MMDMPSSIFMPLLEDLSENERAWIGFIRLVSMDSDPAPTLSRVQSLRRVFTAGEKPGRGS